MEHSPRVSVIDRDDLRERLARGPGQVAEILEKSEFLEDEGRFLPSPGFAGVD
jgi:hypothetical protein